MHVHVERTSSRFGHLNGLDWLQAERMTFSILTMISASPFDVPILLSTSLAPFPIRQVTFDSLEFNTTPMNLQVFCSKDMRAYTMDAIRRSIHESTKPNQ